MERGVVFSAYELQKLENGNGFQSGEWLTNLDVNYLTLYWDKLVCPTNNIIVRGIHNEDDLKSCGILTRPKFIHGGIVNSDSLPDLYADSHAKTIDILRHRDASVDWQMFFLGEQANLKKEHAKPSEILRFELLNLLPVPAEGTPLNEILEFKFKWKPELIALHSYMDELHQSVLSSGDLSINKSPAMERLSGAISDIEKINGETWRSPIKFSKSTSFEFSLTQLYGAGATAFLAYNQPYPYNVLGGASSLLTLLGGCVKVKVQIQSVLYSGDKNLAYVSKAYSSGII